jgi:hypothetical protein
MDLLPELKHFYKQPGEKFFIDGNFEDVLTTGEEIVLNSSTVTAVDSQGEDATDDVLFANTKTIQDNTKLAIRCQAGAEASSPYKITFTISTDLDNVWEIDVQMRVEEI